ncbi:MAG: MFS transporter [Asticcacaulis sp.]
MSSSVHSPADHHRPARGVVIAATVGNMVSMTTAVSSVFGVFLVPIADGYGWPRAQVTGVLGLIALVSVIAYPIAGRLIDRYGARRMLIIGHVLFGLSLLTIGLNNGDLWRFYVIFGLAGAIGALPSASMFSKLISEWFDEKRGLMLGIANGLGNGIGATLMPVMAALFLGFFGWKTSYVLIGVMVLAIGFPVLFSLLKEAPHTTQDQTYLSSVKGLTLREASATPAFWLILTTLGLGAGALTAIFSHIVPVLTDRNISLGLATGVMSVLALTCAAGQIGIGAILDRLRSPRLIAPAFVIAAASLFQLETGQTALWLIPAGIGLGIGLATAFGALPYFISRYFGLKHFGAITGLIYAMVMLAQGMTPLLMDIWYDHFGSYTGAIHITQIVLICIAGLILALPAFRDTTVNPGRAHNTLHTGL